MNRQKPPSNHSASLQATVTWCFPARWSSQNMRGGSFIDLTLDDESSSRNHQNDNNNRRPRGKSKIAADNLIDAALNEESDCPLPYNQSIVQRLKEEATESRFLRDAINRALPSIKQYQYPITNKKIALKVDGIGPMIADIIAAHLEATGLVMHQMKRTNNDLTHHSITNKQKRKKIYIPRRGKGGWALLYYMYIMWMKTGRDTFRKEELQKGAQLHCGTSYTDKQVCELTAFSS